MMHPSLACCARGLAIVLLLFGCKKREDAGTGGAAAEPTVDVSADREALAGSWILDVARDPGPLGKLAQSNPGWGALFTSKPGEALDAFEKSLRGGGDVATRIGAARAALQLAEAHAAIATLVAEQTPALMKAQGTRPGAEKTAAARGLVLARQALLVGADAQAHLAAVAADGPLGAWVALLAEGNTTPAAALFRGEAAGADASLPEGATEALQTRLRLLALVDGGQLDKARALMRGLDPREPDLQVGEGAGATAYLDPIAARALAHVYAATAAAHLEGVGGWAELLRARALRLRGEPGEAAKALEALLEAPPEKAELAQLVLGRGLAVDDLKWEATAERAVALAEAGDTAAGKALAETIPIDRVAQRVFKAWALAHVGDEPDAKAFPADRAVVTGAVTDALVKLGEGAAGRDDVQQLALVDRYADALQRRYAQAMAPSKPSLAVKARESAEDKAHTASPSPRNTLSSLAATALDNARIGRPRVALKYLTRLAEVLPAVAGPAEMLRDLLSLRAMEQGGGATSGQ